MKSTISFLLASVALGACAPAPTQITLPAPVAASVPGSASLARAEAPSFTVGEEWEYDFRSDLDPAQNAQFLQKVLKTDGDETTIELSHGRSGFIVLDKNGSSRRSGTGLFEPSDQRLQFPLFVGKTWSASYVFVNGGWRSACKRSVKVEAFERVQTKAGVFDAFRLSEKTLWQSNDLYGGTGITRETIWYAPLAKRIVKSDLRDSPVKGAMVSTHYELLQHREPGGQPKP